MSSRTLNTMRRRTPRTAAYLEAHGWTVAHPSGGHPTATSPDGRRVSLSLSLSPSRATTDLNQVTRLRRADAEGPRG